MLGQAIQHVARESVLISTKATFQFGDGPNNVGSSKAHLTRQIDGSLKRLKTDYIDVYHMHGFDALTPVEETLSTLDNAVRQGKMRISRLRISRVGTFRNPLGSAGGMGGRAMSPTRSTTLWWAATTSGS